MRADRWRLTAAIFASCCSAQAIAGVGIGVSGSYEQEQYRFTTGEATVDWQTVTLRPWWGNDQWHAEAEIPWLQRDASLSGTIYVHRWVAGHWVLVPVTISRSQTDNALGESYLRLTRNWHVGDLVSPYLAGELKLPGDNPDTSGATVPSAYSFGSSRGSRDGYSFGNDATGFRLAPGLTIAGDLAWATLEGSYIWSDPGDIPVDDRAAAYAGFGLTPLNWLGLTAEFDYEEPMSAGGDPLEQWTFSLTITPLKALSVSLSTYTINSDTAPDSTWTLDVSLRTP